MNGWLTVSQAAKQLGLSERTVRRRCEAGQLPARFESGEGGGRAWRIDPEAVSAGNDRTDGRPDGQAAKETVTARPEGASGAASEWTHGQTVTDRTDAWPSERPESSGQADTDLARIQGYLARDMELSIARAVEAAQAPLLEEIRALRAEVAQLRESRQEPPQDAQSGGSVVESQPAAQDTQRPQERKPMPLWLRWFGIRLKC